MGLFLIFRGETLRCALDVLSICTVLPQVQLILCDSIPMPDSVVTPAISVLLGLADGEIADADVQKSALNVIINCVCAPVNRVSSL